MASQVPRRQGYPQSEIEQACSCRIIQQGILTICGGSGFLFGHSIFLNVEWFHGGDRRIPIPLYISLSWYPIVSGFVTCFVFFTTLNDRFFLFSVGNGSPNFSLLTTIYCFSCLSYCCIISKPYISTYYTTSSLYQPWNM